MLPEYVEELDVLVVLVALPPPLQEGEIIAMFAPDSLLIRALFGDP
jgi:hypothetical protein